MTDHNIHEGHAHGGHHHHEEGRPATQAATRQPEAPEGVIYTCPMHPQIRQVGPGTCPICGMTLEPEVTTKETGPSAELVDMTRRFWIGLALSLPVLALEMGGHLTNLHMLLGARLANWIQLVLATPVVLWAGWPFFERAWASLLNRSLNMFTLIAMGTGVARIYSVVATAAPDIFPATFRAADGSVAIYFEAAAVITVLVLLGQFSNSVRGSRPAGPSGRCSTSHRRPPAASVKTDRTRTSGWTSSRSGTVCAYGPARRSLSTGSCWRAAAPWTNP